jgi:hypothetical protein
LPDVIVPEAVTLPGPPVLSKAESVLMAVVLASSKRSVPAVADIPPLLSKKKPNAVSVLLIFVTETDGEVLVPLALFVAPKRTYSGKFSDYHRVIISR